jgi:hypothetical protein
MAALLGPNSAIRPARPDQRRVRRPDVAHPELGQRVVGGRVPARVREHAQRHARGSAATTTSTASAARVVRLDASAGGGRRRVAPRPRADGGRRVAVGDGCRRGDAWHRGSIGAASRGVRPPRTPTDDAAAPREVPGARRPGPYDPGMAPAGRRRSIGAVTAEHGPDGPGLAARARSSGPTSARPPPTRPATPPRRGATSAPGRPPRRRDRPRPRAPAPRRAGRPRVARRRRPRRTRSIGMVRALLDDFPAPSGDVALMELRVRDVGSQNPCSGPTGATASTTPARSCSTCSRSRTASSAPASRAWRSARWPWAWLRSQPWRGWPAGVVGRRCCSGSGSCSPC